MVDRDDDVKLGLRTSAITFGRFDVAAVMLCYAIYLCGMVVVGLERAAGAALLRRPRRSARRCALWHWWLIRGRDRDALLPRVPAQSLAGLRGVRRGRGRFRRAPPHLAARDLTGTTKHWAGRRAAALSKRTTMPRFAANLSMMFNEVPFAERFAAAARAGFKGVEFLFPYELPAPEVARLLRANALENALFNLPPGDWAAGERGLASLPGREADFRASVEVAIEYALALGTPTLHAMCRPAARRGRPGRAPRRLRREPAPRGTRARAARPHAGDRADQPPRHARVLPQHPGRGARGARGGGRAQPQGADGPLPRPDRRGRPRRQAAPAHRGHRPRPDRQRSGPARAGRGRGELPATSSGCSTSSATAAGSAASTARGQGPRTGSAGCPRLRPDRARRSLCRGRVVAPGGGERRPRRAQAAARPGRDKKANGRREGARRVAANGTRGQNRQPTPMPKTQGLILRSPMVAPAAVTSLLIQTYLTSRLR